MGSEFNITLPAALRKWVAQQVAKKSYATTDAFFEDVLRREQAREVREHIEVRLLDSIKGGEARPMTSKDWAKIREAGRRRFAARRRK